MESDPGCEGYPIALQKSDAWGAAAAVEEAQMTWLTWRHVLLPPLENTSLGVDLLIKSKSSMSEYNIEHTINYIYMH